MKLVIWVACFCLVCGSARGGEPTGGLANAALAPSDLGGEWTRRIEYLFDPNANPPEVFQVATNISRRPPLPPLSADEVGKLIARQKEDCRGFAITNLARLGAEAQIILEYIDSKHNARFSMQIYRYRTAQGMEDMWKRRKERREHHLATVAGEEVIYTVLGQMFPGGVRASKPSVEERLGRYHVMVSPGKPEQGDAGLGLVKRQVEKLQNSTKPDGAANGSRPIRSETNRTSSAAGSRG